MDNPVKNDNTDTARQTLHLLPAGLSLICPGLGQLVQGRIVQFLCRLFLWGLVIMDGWLLYPVFLITLDIFLSPGRYAFEGGDFLILLILLLSFGLPILSAIFLVLFSVLDAATWEHGKPLQFKSHLFRLTVLLVPISVFLLYFTPPLGEMREAARRMQCSGHFSQLGLAFHNYHDIHGSFPPAYTVDENGKPLHSWRVLLLPFMEQSELYKKIRLDEPWNSEYNRQFHDIQLSMYQCPSRHHRKMKTANCDYSVVIGEETVFPGAATVKYEDITDGLPDTILVVERMVPICWMDPNNEIRFDIACEGINKHTLGIGSAHPGGANVCFGAGRNGSGVYRFIPQSIKDLKPFLTKSAGDNND